MSDVETTRKTKKERIVELEASLAEVASKESLASRGRFVIMYAKDADSKLEIIADERVRHVEFHLENEIIDARSSLGSVPIVGRRTITIELS